MRVTPEQAAVFAAFDEHNQATVWYRLDPKLEGCAEMDSRNDEFIWLRDLANDLLDTRTALANCEADYAAIVRTLKEVQNRYWDESRTELVKAALSTPRAVAALKVTP
jgi:hypothetical protein